MVLVPRHQLADRLGVGLAAAFVDRLRRERLVRRAEHDRGQLHVLPDRGGLVDDHDAVPVGVVQHLLGMRVVGRPERVGADPVHQRDVVHEPRVVVPLALDRQVLVLAEPGEPERLAVDEELRAPHLDRPDADRQRVAVDHLVAVGRARPGGRRGSPPPAARDARPRRSARPRRRPPARPRCPRRPAARRAPVRRPSSRSGSPTVPVVPSRPGTTVMSSTWAVGVQYSHTDRCSPA